MTYNPDESNMTPHMKAMNALYYEIGREDLDYVDNFRVAKKSDRRSVYKYIEAQKKGCCGSMDTTVVIDGEEWMIGCNYGH